MLRSLTLMLSSHVSTLAFIGGLNYMGYDPYFSVNALLAGIFIGATTLVSFSVAKSIKEDINA